MLALAVDLDPVAAGRDGIHQAGLFIQLRAHLVEIRDLQLGAEADGAAIGLFLAQDQLQQRGLAGAVGTDQADLVAAQDGGGKIAHDGFRAKALADVVQLGHDLAGALAGRHVEPDLALLFAPGAALQAQGFQAPHPPFVAHATGLDALADPDLFLRQELVELGVFDFLDLQLFCLAHLIGAEIAGEGQ